MKLEIYTDGSVKDGRAYSAFIALTETTHVMSRVYEEDTDNIYEAECRAAIRALTEITNVGYESVSIYLDNKAACSHLNTLVAAGEAPFNKFSNIEIDIIKGHQKNKNPNKVADMLASLGGVLYDRSMVEQRILYYCKFPSKA